jgi:hypothetical protein
MSITADFYDGRGPHARWLGSLQHHADPAGVLAAPPGRLALTATDPAAFADAVEDLLLVWEEHTDIGNAFPPADGWPWTWPDSSMTDWVYAFDNGHPWARGDQGWVALDPHTPDPFTAITTGIHTPGTTEPVDFPRMRPSPHSPTVPRATGRRG